ncbi:hypothetical protein AMTRI_Chr08g166480 [Amborella trichopoda]|uniref:Uncharacterized protein n=1 Tax=Amborella trichopoda TaxID=13333 RepID=W1PBZ5_AMBTC|nr:protein TRIGALACTOSYLDIACYLGLYCEROL 1, chloroplastic [Amborella trichopoda]ERN05199.1 hypothetical protein AMTR_s00007p00030640 [Amborella trichopoda]|eukprot:XP_006843524.1 protein TRIGALACTOSYLDIACYLGLYCEROL 1, chloroplastic [Amborella trichopoda]
MGSVSLFKPTITISSKPLSRPTLSLIKSPTFSLLKNPTFSLIKTPILSLLKNSNSPVIKTPHPHSLSLLRSSCKKPICQSPFASLQASDGSSSHLPEGNNAPGQDHYTPLLSNWSPPRYLWRGISVFILAGQVIFRSLTGKIHYQNSLQQLERVGPRSVGVCLLTATFVGMAFTIQFVREFTRLGLNRSVGGVLALAFSRELSPVVTSIVIAGRIGSAFAAELGTMQVSEQTDTLRVLGTNPVDYLVTPRVIACCIALPILTLLCFVVGMAASALLADAVYGVSINIILDSAKRALRPWDIVSAMVKSTVFGGIISIVSCAWGVTTLGGAKGVGESTTSAVVISLVSIFIADFVLSYCFFQGAGDSLKSAMG